VQALIAALDGSGKPLLHTSGSSLVGDESRGNRSTETVIDEDTPFVVGSGKQHRYDIDRTVRQAADRGVRAAVICPSLIYGVGRGLNPRSVQIPLLVDNAREQGVVQVVGRGLNRWSNVHVDDLTDLYLLALAEAPAGALYFAENGEACFAELGAAIAARLELSAMEFLPPEAATEKWGESRAYYTLGSNSRVRARRARHELGWTPRHASAVSWILSEMPL
jgi:nucleoside-diphosphate-sugar epimerase